MKRRKRFLLVLPLLTIPFLTFAFWALGGGSDTGETPQKNEGLNLELPGANLKEDNLVDKLGYYEKAESDSERIKQLMKNDPYFKTTVDNDTMVDHSMEEVMPPAVYERPVASGRKNYSDPNEAKIYKKLGQLNTIINTNEKIVSRQSNPVSERLPSIPAGEVDRLEQMMKSINGSENIDDPEMKQLNGMMEKILDIQHPERIKEKIKKISVKNKENAYPVTEADDEVISLIEPPVAPDTLKPDSLMRRLVRAEPQKENDFYSFNEDAEDETHNAIEAVVHETQTIVGGAPVKLRLLNDIYINGVLIPKDNFIFGTASLSGERLKISIHTIRYQNSLLPVALSIYDIDGLEGIYIPGAISRDVAKQSADDALQNIEVTSVDPSISRQALGIGIEAGKNLLSKKAKAVRVTVKAGYKVLLKDNNNK